jgi:hypothetical protein
MPGQVSSGVVRQCHGGGSLSLMYVGIITIRFDVAASIKLI